MALPICLFIDEKAAAAGEVKGIEAIVKVINTHFENAGVCENGCGALWNITEHN